MWKEPIHELGLEKLGVKLKKSKIALKSWNKNIFGCVDQNISELDDRLALAEDNLQNNYSTEVEQELIITKSELEC